MSRNGAARAVELLSAFLIIFHCSDIVIGQRSPTITYISDSQSLDLGSSVELACSVQYGGDYSVIWLKRDKQSNDTVYLSTGTSLVLKESRFTLLYDGASATYIILIKDLQAQDAGTYQCEIVLSVNNKITAETELAVRRPPIITDNSTQALVSSEGLPVQLECFAEGFPPPRVYWRRENSALLPSGGSVYNGNILKITSVHKEDRGAYYCFAENGVGRGDRRSVNLEIEFPPVITVPRTRMSQALRNDIDLECHVEAFPAPQIIWVKDDFLLSNGNKHKISNFITADEFTDSTLRVVSLKDNQFGIYKCKAVNKLGDAEASIELFESSTPVCPPSCGQGYNRSGSIHKSEGALCILIAFVLILTSDSRRFH